MVAPWIRAETVVGPSIARISQGKSGNCPDFPMAATKMKTEMTKMKSLSRAPEAAIALSLTISRLPAT